MERKSKCVSFREADDPESKLKAELGRLSEDESKEAVLLKVDAGNCGGVDQVDRIAKALVRLSRPHWILVLGFGLNDLESVPDSVWELANLEGLGLNNNKLKTLSPAIAKLTKLRKLWIEWNSLEGFPEAVCKLEQLEVLNAEGCRLSALPSSFASLRNLLELYLGDNSFEQFPEAICELGSLRLLWLNDNKLSSLPQSFAKLRELRQFCISYNRFKEFPEVVCELPNLENLDMGKNQLSELPLAITKLVRLKYLNLSENSFTSFPLFVGDLPQLSAFSSYGNPLQGPQSGLSNANLLRFLQQRCVIPRLTDIIAAGFCCEQHVDWARFLFQGLYDPRLFIFIFDFAFDFALFDEEDPRKRGHFE